MKFSNELIDWNKHQFIEQQQTKHWNFNFCEKTIKCFEANKLFEWISIYHHLHKQQTNKPTIGSLFERSEGSSIKAMTSKDNKCNTLEYNLTVSALASGDEMGKQIWNSFSWREIYFLEGQNWNINVKFYSNLEHVFYKKIFLKFFLIRLNSLIDWFCDWWNDVHETAPCCCQ